MNIIVAVRGDLWKVLGVRALVLNGWCARRACTHKAIKQPSSAEYVNRGHYRFRLGEIVLIVCAHTHTLTVYHNVHPVRAKFVSNINTSVFRARTRTLPIRTNNVHLMENRRWS